MLNNYLKFVVVLVLLTSTAPVRAQSRTQEEQLAASRISKMISMVNNPIFAGELELVDEQKTKLKEIQKKITSFYRRLRNTKNKDEFELLKQELFELAKDVDNDMKKTLLPHQFRRLGQIEFQNRAMITSPKSFGLLDKSVVTQLGLSDEQIKELTKGGEKTSAELANEIKKLQEKIKKLQDEARNDLLKILTDEQKAKYKELFGEPFSPKRS